MKPVLSLLLIFATFLIPLTAEEEADSPAQPKDVGWPREYKTNTHTVVVFQPQVEEWVDYKLLKMRAAVAVSETGKEEEAVYGGIFAQVDTDVDSDSRQVLFSNREVTKLVFPEADDAQKNQLTRTMMAALPDRQELVVSLDRVIAAIELTEQQMKQVEASSEVPPIYVSEEPALLMIFIGEPEFQPVTGTGLLFATNTNWDIFMTTGEKPAYYLRDEQQWFTTSDPKQEKWSPVVKLPDDFSKLPKDENWEETREAIPGSQASGGVTVFYADRPAELIVIEGKPSMAPVGSPALMYVKNTDADLFFHAATSKYYFLSSGRWFTSGSLSKDWAFAPDELPAEFSAIPEDHEKSHVLASVRGTPAASEALVMASIPEQATVSRADTTVEVVYEGEPKFAAIPGTNGVEFALNSNFDVFRVVNNYYCCFQGVWFVASSPTGPWAVCDDVPEPIYEIPADHPKHNVTYVNVTESTPETVQTSYTSGYTGSYIVNGLVTFGLGYWITKERYDNDYWYYWRRYHCRPTWYGYGCRATWYNGRYWRGGSRWYGPYGGAGRNAIYNPRTGGWARSAYAYGPRGSAYTRAAYNPYTNTFGKVTRVNTPYGSWSKGVVNRNGNWAKGGKYTTARGTVGGASGSRGGAFAGYDKRFGGQGGVLKTPGGDVYLGKDGNIHKLDPDRGWQTRQGKQWKDTGASKLDRLPATADRPSRLDTSRLPAGGGLGGRVTTPSTRPSIQPTRPTTRPSVQPTRPTTRPSVQPTRPTTRPSVQPTRPTTRPSVQPSRPTTRPTQTRQLDRSAYSRHRGTATTQRRTSSSRSHGGSRGGSRGGRR